MKPGTATITQSDRPLRSRRLPNLRCTLFSTDANQWKDRLAPPYRKCRHPASNSFCSTSTIADTPSELASTPIDPAPFDRPTITRPTSWLSFVEQHLYSCGLGPFWWFYVSFSSAPDCIRELLSIREWDIMMCSSQLPWYVADFAHIFHRG